MKQMSKEVWYQFQSHVFVYVNCSTTRDCEVSVCVLNYCDS